jgi:hypothetical protein
VSGVSANACVCARAVGMGRFKMSLPVPATDQTLETITSVCFRRISFRSCDFVFQCHTFSLSLSLIEIISRVHAIFSPLVHFFIHPAHTRSPGLPQADQLRATTLHFIARHFARVRDSGGYAQLPLALRAEVRKHLPSTTTNGGGGGGGAQYAQHALSARELQRESQRDREADEARARSRGGQHDGEQQNDASGNASSCVLA